MTDCQISSESRVRDALSFVSPVDREFWVLAGMAVKSELGHEGFEVWDSWSKQAESYRQKDAAAVWKSFRGSGITIASLFHEAKANGWVDTGKPLDDPAEIKRRREQEAARAAKDRAMVAREHADAARKAKHIISQCVSTQHAYLDAKGLPDLLGLVYRADSDNLLIVPMYAVKRLVGCQMISIDGDKKFIHGQQAKGAEFMIGRGDMSCWCEGYATGLSIHAAMKQRLSVHVCFSAGNLAHMAKQAGTGFVVADNDASQAGEKAAKATGLPYYMPEVTGEDFNDEWKRIGTFQASQRLKKFLMSIK